MKLSPTPSREGGARKKSKELGMSKGYQQTTRLRAADTKEAGVQREGMKSNGLAFRLGTQSLKGFLGLEA